MTTITIERQTLERAMAALVYHQEQTRPIERTRIVIEELIAALAAQQAEPQEPVAYVLDGMAYMRAELDGEAVNAASPLYAAQPAPAAVPPGYALVPIEPTPEMIDAGLGKLLYVASPQPRHIYRAMIAAAGDKP